MPGISQHPEAIAPADISTVLAEDGVAGHVLDLQGFSDRTDIFRRVFGLT